jgi:hypothetical protein
MVASSIVVEQSIGKRLSRGEMQRRKILVKALPKIEQYYERLSKSEHIAGESITPKAREQALELYNKVITDGRFVDLLRSDPAGAAVKIGLKVTPEATRAISVIEGELRDPGTVEGPVEAVIAVAVVIACAKPAEGVIVEETANVRVRL